VGQGLALLWALMLSALLFALRRSVQRIRYAEKCGANTSCRPADFAAATLVSAPITLSLIALATLATLRAFANQELAALLAASWAVAIVLGALLATAWFSTVIAAVRVRIGGARAAVWTFLPGLLVAGGGLGFVFLGSRMGGNQLDPGLLAAPFAMLLGGWLASRLLRDRALHASRLAVLAIALGGLAATGLAVPNSAGPLVQYGAWSKPVLRAWRAAIGTDRGRGAAAPSEPFRGDVLAPPRSSGVRPRGVPDRLNVLLVTIETLRADRVSFLGYGRPTTPRLERLAKEGVVFERFYATTPTTRLSIPALLSGSMPSSLAWHAQPAAKRMRRLGSEPPWFPEILRAHGYATFAVHASFRAFTELESAGFDRGFELFDTSTPLQYTGGTMRGFPGERQVDRALSLIASVGERPFFLWVHLLEPHYLYEQPPRAPHFGTSEQDLYDAEIAEADRQTGRLLDALDAQGLSKNTLVVVCGDHGEEFGEHGERWHTSNLYEAQVRTAALLRVPGLGRRTIRTAAALTDLVPTLLDLMGYPEALARMQGRNLVPVLDAPESPLPPFLLENFRVQDGGSHRIALVSWPHKLIYQPDGELLELYDVAKDPLERHNLALTHDKLAFALLEHLRRFREGAAR
jgi:arylsulfatase A-like enzyme